MCYTISGSHHLHLTKGALPMLDIADFVIAIIHGTVNHLVGLPHVIIRFAQTPEVTSTMVALIQASFEPWNLNAI